MVFPTYYEILGVPLDANFNTIRQTFRALIRRCHPDAGGQGPFYFDIVTEAYRTLRDPVRREAYNAALKAGYRPALRASLGHRASLSNRRKELEDSSRLSAPARIGSAIVVRGHLESGRDVRVEGEVFGTVRLPRCRLTVGTNGKVGVYAEANEIEVMGSMIGELRARKQVILRRGCRVSGDIRTVGLVIEDGAHFTGRIEIQEG